MCCIEESHPFIISNSTVCWCGCIIVFQHNQQVVKQNVAGIQWMLPADAGWTTDTTIQTPHYLPYLRGTLGFAIRRGEIPGLKDFLLKIHPDNDPDSSHENAIVSILLDF